MLWFHLTSNGLNQPPFSPPSTVGWAKVIPKAGNSVVWDVIDQIRKQILRYISLEPKPYSPLHSRGPA